MSLTPQDGQELANKIRHWLKISGTRHPSSEVEEFIDDLDNVRNIHTWAGVNYERILPFVVPRSLHITFLAILRNTLVFGPILLTWHALRNASIEFADATRRLREAGEDGQLNFLEFWEQSVGGISRLSTVALWDVILIGALIGLSLYIGVVETSGKRARQLELTHNGLMVSLEQKLSGYRYLSLADMNNLAQGTLQDLNASSQQVATSTQLLSGAAQQAFDAVNNVYLVTATVFQPLLDQMKLTIDSLSLAATSHLDLGQLVKDNRQELANQLDATRLGLAAVVQQVDKGSQSIITSTTAQLQTATDAIARAADVVSNDLAARTSAELATVGATVRDAADDLKRSFSEISDAVDIATEKMRNTFSTLEYGIQQVRDDLEAISDSLKRS